MPSPLFYPYTTLTAVQRETKNSESANDDWYKECINDASRLVEEMLRRDFRYHDHISSSLTCKTVWIAGRELFLPWPIISLTEIAVNGDALDAADYKWENLNNGKGGAVITRAGARSWDGEALPFEISGCANEQEYQSFFGEADYAPTKAYPDPALYTVTLKGTFGYALAAEDDTTQSPTNIPATVKRATTLIAAALSGLNRKEVVGLDGDKIGLMDSRIPKEAWDLIKGLKISVV
jgi:hypothetical protein